MWYPAAVNNETVVLRHSLRISRGRALDLRIRFMDLAVIFELSGKRERERKHSSKVLRIERSRSRELCGTSYRVPRCRWSYLFEIHSLDEDPYYKK